MKISPLSAFVLFGLAGLVGGVTWFASDQDRIGSEPAHVPTPTVRTPVVEAVSPYDKKLAQRLETAKAKLASYAEDGKVLPNGEIKIMDEDGTPRWVHPKLFEGVGRFGEPLYLSATYKKRPALPMVRDRKNPGAEAVNARLRKMPKGKSVVTMGKKPGANNSGANPTTNDGNQDSSKDTGSPPAGPKPGKPGKPGEDG